MEETRINQELAGQSDSDETNIPTPPYPHDENIDGRIRIKYVYDEDYLLYFEYLLTISSCSLDYNYVLQCLGTKCPN